MVIIHQGQFMSRVETHKERHLPSKVMPIISTIHTITLLFSQYNINIVIYNNGAQSHVFFSMCRHPNVRLLLLLMLFLVLAYASASASIILIGISIYWSEIMSISEDSGHQSIIYTKEVYESPSSSRCLRQQAISGIYAATVWGVCAIEWLIALHSKGNWILGENNKGNYNEHAEVNRYMKKMLWN